MLLKYLLGAALLTPCGNGAYAMEWPTRQELFLNQQEFVGVNSLSIKGSSGSVVVQPSMNDRTVVSYDGQAEIIREGNRLIVREPQRSFFSFFSSVCNFCVNVSTHISYLDIDSGNGHMTIDGTHLRQLNISGGGINVLLKEMRGEVKINSGRCDLSYLSMSRQRGPKVNFLCDVGDFSLTAFLSDAFTGFCSLLNCASLQIKEAFLPIKSVDAADIVLRGSCGTAKVSIKRNGE